MPGKKGYQHDEVSLVILDYNSWALTEFVLGRTICYSFHDLQDKGILNVVSLIPPPSPQHGKLVFVFPSSSLGFVKTPFALIMLLNSFCMSCCR